MALHQSLNSGKSIKHVNTTLLIIIVSAILLNFGLIFYATYHSLHQMTTNAAHVQTEFNGKKPFSVLLLGTDTGYENRHEKYGNSDTAIIATVIPTKKRVDLVSIPRDTLAQIQTKDRPMEKINAAYSIGGPKQSLKSISKLLNVPLKYYATVNMKGLIQIVNDLGGVTVKVPFKFSYDWCDFHKGYQHLNGRHALAYARMRHDDPKGDYGRQMRQRQIITAAVKKLAASPDLTKVRNLIDHAGHNVKTNLTVNSLLSIAQSYKINTIKSDYLHGKDATIDNLSYQVASTKELQRVSDKIRSDLNLPKEKLTNADTYSNRYNKAFFKNLDDLNYNVVRKENGEHK